jgi:Fe-S-cluster containining protein
MLLPDEGDDVGSYEHEIVTLPAGTGPVLKKIDGHCVYLVDDRCSIHERAPLVCRVFDCRRWYLRHDRATRRRMIREGHAAAEIFDAGRDRLHTLEGVIDGRPAATRRGPARSSTTTPDV